MKRFWYVALGRLIRALLPRKRKTRAHPQPPSKPSRLQGDAEFVRKMKEIAATSNGTVQVLEPSGRRQRPNDLSIVTLERPGDIIGFTPFISADVRIDGIRYGFHAYAHPKSNRYSRFWLYFSVSGPARETGVHDEFQITDEFRWTGERPWNPLLVKYALRQWVKEEAVQQAIAKAKAGLPKPPRRTDHNP